jgi:hypothetical protein
MFQNIFQDKRKKNWVNEYVNTFIQIESLKVMLYSNVR